MSTPDLSDGRAHAIPCPAERHATDGDPPMLYVRHLTADRAWVLHCWSRSECSHAEIAHLLDIEADTDGRIGSNPVSDLVAAYDHPNPDESPRLVFHSGRNDGDSQEMAFRGTANGVHLLLWAPDGPDSTLVVAGTEWEAMALMRAGVHRHAFVPVTWHRAVKRLEDDSDSVSRADWTRVEGRRIVFWPDHTTRALAEMYRAAGMALAAGAAQMLVVDPGAPGLNEAGDASPLDLNDVLAALGRARVLPWPQDAADSDAPPGGTPEPTPDVDAYAAAGMPGADETPEPRPENAIDVALSISVLREHGQDMVVASRPEGSEPPVAVYWRAISGVLHRSTRELDLALWTAAETQIAELRGGEAPSATEVADHMPFLNRVASASGRRAVIESLPLAHSILLKQKAVPAGLRSVPAETIDADARYVGAPNGVVDLETGRLLSGTEARRALVSHTLPDPYDGNASHRLVDRLTAHMDEEDRENLLDALAYALGAGSADRIYVIHGGQARSALLSSVRMALGPRYSGTAPLAMLLTDRSRSTLPVQPTPLGRFTGPRILVGYAPAGSGSLDPGLLYHLTLQDAVMERTLGGHRRSLTATMFVALDPDALEDLDSGGSHSLARIRVLQYHDPEVPDTELIQRAGHTRAFRQALIALLVRRCAAMSGPPDHIPHPLPRRSAADPEADRWLLDAIEVTGRSSDRLASSVLWDAARAAPGSGSDPDRAWGMSRRSLTMRAISLHRLGRTRSVRIDGEPVTGWMGVRLARGGSDLE